MIIIGVTGLIATGKSTITDIFAKENYPVFDADKEVHKLFLDADIIKKIKSFASLALVNGKIDRNKLSNLAFKDPKILKKLEAVLHPAVREKLDQFLHENFIKKAKLVVLDIPLLYQSNISNICDYIIYVKCSVAAQKSRYLKRKNATLEKFKEIYKKQKLDIDVNQDFVIDTTMSKVRNKPQVRKIIKEILRDAGNSFRYRDYGFKHRQWRQSN